MKAHVSAEGPRVLYIVYWGALEPLGQSLVVPSVLELARRGVSITLVSYEKPADLKASGSAESLRRVFESAGVRWVPLRYHKHWRVPATVFDVVNGWLRGTWLAWRWRPEIVHARTFVGGLIGLGVAQLFRCGFVYHNEGFYPDEQVDSGVWRADSAAYRVAKHLESCLYAQADGVLTLSNAAQTVVRELPAVRRRETPITVVPSAVDLALFTAPTAMRDPVADGPFFIYAGSIGGRYLFQEIAAFVAFVRSRQVNTRLTVLSWADREEIASVLRTAGLPDAAWGLDRLPREQMPAALARHHAGLHLVRTATGGRGGSPTKVGEYWACGLPVLVSAGLGDLDEIIAAEGVGVSLAESSRECFEAALLELQRLWQDADCTRRCRLAAQRHYCLRTACDAQIAVYQQIAPAH